MSAKPLFIPLIGKWFDAFANGSKTFEFRRYGRRWNERTCPVGRRVVLSRGYGKQNRLGGVINGFYWVAAASLSDESRAAIEETFGTLDLDIAQICIHLDRGR